MLPVYVGRDLGTAFSLLGHAALVSPSSLLGQGHRALQHL